MNKLDMTRPLPGPPLRNFKSDFFFRNNLVRALTVERFPAVSSCRMLASSISLSLACTALLSCSFVSASGPGDGSGMESTEPGTALVTKVILSDVLSQSTDCFRPEKKTTQTHTMPSVKVVKGIGRKGRIGCYVRSY